YLEAQQGEPDRHRQVGDPESRAPDRGRRLTGLEDLVPPGYRGIEEDAAEGERDQVAAHAEPLLRLPAHEQGYDVDVDVAARHLDVRRAQERRGDHRIGDEL